MSVREQNAKADRPAVFQQIEAQAQERSTCPVCKGKKVLHGRTVRPAATNRISTEPPDTLTQLVIECPKCDGRGTVPAGPQGDPAAWAAEGFLHAADIAAELDKLRNHLAAMPQAQPDVNAEMLRVLKDFTGLFINYIRGGCWDQVTIRENSTMHHEARAAVAQAEKAAAR